MYFLTTSSCGWIPPETVNFIAQIIDIIKVLTPVILVIMGSIDFAKAVMSQNDSQIKSAQSAFIKKVIAGVAVFFVIVIIQWITKLLNSADSKTGAASALSCLESMLNGSYSQDDSKYLEDDDDQQKTTAKKTTSTCKECISKHQSEIQACIKLYEDGTYGGAQGARTAAYEACDNQYEKIEDIYIEYEECIDKNNTNISICKQYLDELSSITSNFGLSYNSIQPCSISNNNLACYSYEQHQEACNAYANKKENDYKNTPEQYKTLCEHDVCQQCNY